MVRPRLERADARGLPGDDRDAREQSRREARDYEARLLLAHIEPLLEAGHEVLVLGDFNANPSDKALAVYKDAGYVNAYGKRWMKSGNTRDLFRTHESNRVIDYIMMHPNLDAEAIARGLPGPVPHPDARLVVAVRRLPLLGRVLDTRRRRGRAIRVLRGVRHGVGVGRRGVQRRDSTTRWA